MPRRANAQRFCQIAFKAVDARSGDKLQGVTLSFDGIVHDLRSDSAGLVRSALTCGEHLVQARLLGYKPFALRMEVSDGQTYELPMENIATQIEEVVISSQGAVRTLETPALGVNLLSVKAMQKISPAAGEVDVLRSLQTLPGITSIGEGANGLNIRGGQADQNLLLLDNMPVFNPTHLLGLFSLFPTDAIQEMQIYKGSVPARYGGRTAGVLDVRLSEPGLENFKMSGGVGLISNRLHTEIPLIPGKLGWMSSLRFSFNEYLIRFYNEILAGPVKRRRIPNANPQFVDFANKIVWRPNQTDKITLAHYSSYDSYRADTLFGIANIVPRHATMRYGHHNASLSWNHLFSEKLNLNVQAVRADYHTSTDASDVRASFEYKTRLVYHHVKAEANWLPSARQRLNGGVNVVRYDVRAANLRPLPGSSVATVALPKEQAWEIALYAAYEYELTDRLLVEPGLRYVNYWNMGATSVPVYDPEQPKSFTSILEELTVPKNRAEYHSGRLEPRLALRYLVNARSSIKVGYNRMNQFLLMLTNNATPLPNVRWKTATRYVSPVQSDLVSIGYFHDTPDRMWEWSLETYHRWQRDIFDFSNGAELNINPNVETQLVKGRARAYGAELFINKKKGVMTGWMSYTYSRALQQILGDFPVRQQLNNGEWFRSNIDRPHTLNVLLNFQTEKHNSASFTFVYQTGRPYTAPVSFYRDGLNVLPVYVERNNVRISDYHRLDFSWTISNPSMKARRWQTTWVFTVYNLYGRKNAFSYFFDPKRSAFQPFKVSVFPAPILSLTYNFKFNA